VAEIAQNATAHWWNLLTPTVTSDAQLSWYLQCAPGLTSRDDDGDNDDCGSDGSNDEWW
jgi:hypothetical protein